MKKNKYTYLALGDSYTIGEAVAATDNFPNKTVQLLNKAGYDFTAPDIVAKTGWTTDELQAGMREYHFQKKYDVVSLLIGVNNQYRGRNAAEYAKHFEALLNESINFAGKNPAFVFVLSIPDWGATPFAEGKNRELIGKEVDEFNAINKRISARYHVNYIDITAGTREAANDESLLASDKLHPSAKEYERWAKKLAQAIIDQLK